MGLSPVLALAVSLVAIIAVACAPSTPSPTSAPPKPAATAAPAKPTEAPPPKPTTAPAKPTEAPAAKPAAAPTEKPTAKPEAKSAFDEKAVADFYRGKTIRILVGSSAGGGFDFYARLVAKYMPKYMPGNPTMIVENRPPNIITANAVYNSEPKDGTAIGTFTEQQVMFQLQGGPGVEYDAARYNWLGAVTKGRTACLARLDAGISSIRDTMNGKELIVGTNAPGSNIHDVPAVFKGALNLNFKLVPGYGGLAPLLLAVEQKEIDALCSTFTVMASRVASMVEPPNPTAKFIIVTRRQTPEHAYLRDVPTAFDLATTDEAKAVVESVIAPDDMSKPYAVAPEVPRERVEALRAALARTAADREFIAEAAKGGEEVDFTSGEEVGRIAQRLLSTPAPIVAKLKEIVK